MPIRPIDVYTMPPKSQETSNMQKNNMDRAVHGEQVANQQFQEKVNRNMQKTVHAKDKDDNQGFRFDAKEKGHNEYQDNRKKQKEKEKPPQTKPRLPGMNGSSFDITI